MYVVHFAIGNRCAISCACTTYRAALAWVRDNWTNAETGELLTPVIIVRR